MPSIPLQGGNGEVWPFRWWHFSPQPNCLTAGLKKPQCSRERDSPVGIQNGLGLLPSHKFLFGWNMAILIGSIPIHIPFLENHVNIPLLGGGTSINPDSNSFMSLREDILEGPSKLLDLQTIWEMIFPFKLMEKHHIHTFSLKPQP